MPKSARHPWTEHLAWYGSGLILVVLGFVVAYQFVEPAPPTSIRIATGHPQNAYYQFGQQYREKLAAEGIDLEVISTAGSVENLERLTQDESRVDIALVQGGIGSHETHPGLQALASLYFEPLWVFHRQALNLQYLNQSRGLRIGIGIDGSGTQAIAKQLLTDNAVSEQNSQLLRLSSSDASDHLLRGELDALFIVASPQSQIVQRLLHESGISLFSFERAEAYTRRHRFLSAVTLPPGAIDLGTNLPAENKTLLAPAATLVARDDFHPALSSLMLQALTQAHSQGGLFEAPGQFPSTQFVDYPLSDEANRYFKTGAPFLQRYLPFWAATLIDRLIIMIVPLVTLMIPLMKILPPTYRWRVRSRIYRWYDQLREFDEQATDCHDQTKVRALLEELQTMELEVMHQQVPKSYADAQYNLRLHLRLIRERLERAHVAHSPLSPIHQSKQMTGE